MLDYNSYADMVEEAVKSLQLPASPAGLYDPIRYTLDGGGKRIRPVLAIAAAQACGAEPATALNQAVGIELFHNFTLLHDDVMDHADMRRGRPTVHLRWNERIAILSGDAMLTIATRQIAKSAGDHLDDALALFNDTALQIYEGQQLDMDFESDLDVTVEQYLEMIRLKTSVLLGCACRMGAIMAGAGRTLEQQLYDYGVMLGMAFQLRDDLLDTYGDPIVFGKRVGGDIINDKKTWLLITALAEDISGRIEEIIVTGKPDDEDKVVEVRGIYDSLSLKERCSDLIRSYAEQAIGIIESTTLAPEAKNFFRQLAMNTITRSH